MGWTERENSKLQSIPWVSVLFQLFRCQPKHFVTMRPSELSSSPPLLQGINQYRMFKMLPCPFDPSSARFGRQIVESNEVLLYLLYTWIVMSALETVQKVFFKYFSFLLPTTISLIPRFLLTFLVERYRLHQKFIRSFTSSHLLSPSLIPSPFFSSRLL